jgi:D-arabinose 1-dehydrogenase-like Zn-dependent alcohol dehydrogenase
VHEVPLSQKLLSVFLVFFVFGILLPVTETAIRWIRALCHPITFPYKHVLITGCGTGLGKALVQEIFMKGAVITMIGRDQEKLIKLAQ